MGCARGDGRWVRRWISQPNALEWLSSWSARGTFWIRGFGTRSWHHAALVAHIVGPENVVSIERIPRLAERGRSNLARTGYAGVTVVVGDGSLGYPEKAPYDCILATAGAPEIPGPWRRQLSSRGRIVAPIGPRSGQILIVASRRADGNLEIREGTPCAFVPLVGARAWPD